MVLCLGQYSKVTDSAVVRLSVDDVLSLKINKTCKESEDYT